jgi:transcriptional regulator GlxA family with amidase domain
MPKHSHACTRGIDLLPDAIYVVSDDGVYTSAGVSSGIDLALALVESDHGPDLARARGASLSTCNGRAGSPNSPRRCGRRCHATRPACRDRSRLRRPGKDHTIDFARRGGNGQPRHLGRLFAEELHAWPSKFIEQMRV